MYAEGYFEGGTAANIEVGFAPTFVTILNLAGDEVLMADLNQVFAFDGGGTNELKAGYKIRGATNGWEAIVGQVVLVSGTWAGGDARGFLILEPGTLDPASPTTTDNENFAASEFADGTPTGNWGTLMGSTQPISAGTSIEASAAAESSIKPYYGASGDKARGFSVGTTVGTASELMKYQAWGGNISGE